MSEASGHPESESLRARVEQLERINDALMRRVERMVDGSGTAYAIFEQNIVMQKVIRERTRELADTNERLKAEVAERRHAEAAMRAARDQAEAASAAKSQFLANMSHEIRTPMTAILGFLELLDPSGEAGLTPEQAADAYRTVRLNAQHLLRVIDGVLDVSKIEANRVTIERLAVDPVELVEEVATLQAREASEKGVAFGVVFDTPVPREIRTDPTRLRQVLHNLMGNAVKFTSAGSVTVRVSADADEGTISFAIEDTGVGMSPLELATVRRFEAFSQADASMTRRFGGTGLGLRICNGLLTRMGGSLRVDSREGEGSVFTASIPTGTGSEVAVLDGTGEVSWAGDAGSGGATAEGQGTREAAGRDGETEAGEPLAGVRVLLVEDGPDNQRLLRFLLQKAGARVSLTENGLYAVKFVQHASAEEMPHVILMDMQMPVLDGYEATRTLRELGVRVPVIALTAHAMEGDREKCLAAGCDGFLTKPIDRQRLIETCAAFGRRGAETDGTGGADRTPAAA